MKRERRALSFVVCASALLAMSCSDDAAGSGGKKGVPECTCGEGEVCDANGQCGKQKNFAVKYSAKPMRHAMSQNVKKSQLQDPMTKHVQP